MVHLHNEAVLKATEPLPNRIRFLLAVVAFERAAPVYQTLTEAIAAARDYRQPFELGRARLQEWANGEGTIDGDLCAQVNFHFVLNLNNPLSGLAHSFGSHLSELLKQVARDRPHAVSFPSVFNFDIIRSLIAERISKGARVGRTLALGERLGRREAARQEMDARRFIEFPSEPDRVFEELTYVANTHDLLDGETFEALTNF